MAHPPDLPSTRTRIAVYLFSGAVAAAVLWPAFRDPPVDSFPLSTYPMFSYGRPDPHLTIDHALAVHADGTREALPPMMSTGIREVLQSKTMITAALVSGRGQPFCEAIAERVRASGDPDYADVTSIELATSTFHTLDYFDHGPEPVKRTVHVRCEMP